MTKTNNVSLSICIYILPHINATYDKPINNARDD